MGKTTPIEWCDSSVNPVMGCDGCELWIPGKVEHCYAGSLHKIRAGRPGYADQFEVPKPFPGRMAVAAAWNTTPDRTDKPWLHGPRKITLGPRSAGVWSQPGSFSYVANLEDARGRRLGARPDCARA